MAVSAELPRRALGIPTTRLLKGFSAIDMPEGSPRPGAFAREALAALQLARLARSAPWLAIAPRGSGQVVFDVPGWMAPEASMAPVRAFLRFLGYDARAWGGGTNRGQTQGDVRRLAEQVREATKGARAVAIVGWSLGGVVAREVARELPDLVSTVVTFGSPVIGGPTHTLAADSYGELECARIRALALQRESQTPIRVPLTAIYTRRDGVVDWRACIDRHSPRVRHVEVRSTHLGLGVDPDVWWSIAHALHTDA